MMTHQDIQSLIDRYLAGETSNAEEQQLALVLHDVEASDGTLGEEWQVVSLMLGELTLGEALYDDILAKRKARTILLLGKRWRWIAAVAACIVLVAGAGLLLYQESRSVGDERPVFAVMPPDESANTPLSNETPATPEASSPVPVAPADLPVASAFSPRRTSTSSRHSSTSPRGSANLSAAQTALPVEPSTDSNEYEALAQAPPPSEDYYAAIETEMHDIRSRGQYLEAMVNELTTPY